MRATIHGRRAIRHSPTNGSNGRTCLLHGWWISAGPGVAIMTTVVAVNLVGDTLRDVLDPRLRSLTNL